MSKGHEAFIAVFIFVFLVLVVLIFFGAHLFPFGATGKQRTILFSAPPIDFHTVKQTKKEGCAIRGPLPDPACTPGGIFFNVTADQICTPGYARAVRNVSTATKELVYREYGLSYPQASGDFEADHQVPLELGGSNEIANLWPEAAKPVPGYHEKDLVENYLHEEVCAGRVDLLRAQQQIAVNWLAVYLQFTPSQIRALEAQFRQYGN